MSAKVQKSGRLHEVNRAKSIIRCHSTRSISMEG